VEAVKALGAADAEIWRAGADFARSADQRDLKAMWGAADGLARMLEAHMENVGRIDGYGHTRPLADLYRASFPVMLEGAILVRDSIVGGDPQGVVAGTRLLVEGVESYGEIRVPLASYAADAIRMERLLLK
jgi:hypothetical protein